MRYMIRTPAQSTAVFMSMPLSPEILLISLYDEGRLYIQVMAGPEDAHSNKDQSLLHQRKATQGKARLRRRPPRRMPREDPTFQHSDEDWTQITQPRLRKRVQNRVSQRKHSKTYPSSIGSPALAFRSPPLPSIMLRSTNMIERE